VSGVVFPAIFAILTGLLMLVQWSIPLARGTVHGPEAGAYARRGPVEMGFHYVAEFLTATALVISGLALLLGWAWAHPLFLVAMGMLIYTVINSPGFFAQQRQWPMVAMFALLLLLALVSLGLLLVAW
jgi:hypothetical protein